MTSLFTKPEVKRWCCLAMLGEYAEGGGLISIMGSNVGGDDGSDNVGVGADLVSTMDVGGAAGHWRFWA